MTQAEVSVLPGNIAGDRPAHWLRRRLIEVTVGLFVARLALVVVRSGPVLVADEIGYLMNARVLAGGPPGQLQLAPFYHGGYSLIVSPLLDLTQRPDLAYHLVLALNATLSASLFPLLYVLLTRCAGVSPRAAVGPALAGAVYPSVTVLSGAAMLENALSPLTCVWVVQGRQPYSHLKGGWPHLLEIRDPAVLDSELARVRRSTTRSASTPRSGTSPSMTSTTAAARRSVVLAPRECVAPARSESSRIGPTRHEHPRVHRPRLPLPGMRSAFEGSPAGHRWPAEWHGRRSHPTHQRIPPPTAALG